jgi:hypothetical protein
VRSPTQYELSHTTSGESAIGSGMGERAILFCLFGLAVAVAIILIIAPGPLTWALSLVE